MTLRQLNNICILLEEDANKKMNAATQFSKVMEKKYCEPGDCWLRSKMTEEEKTLYDIIRSESKEAKELLEAFIEQDWR